MKTIQIIDRGRGPELERARITVYDILPYLERGWTHSSISLVCDISQDELSALEQYIADHQDEITAERQRIRERLAGSDTPEAEAKLWAHREKILLLKLQLQRKNQQATNGQHQKKNGTSPPSPPPSSNTPLPATRLPPFPTL